MLLITGLLFIAGASEQYFYNSAFHFKAVSLLLMGINVVLFYSLEFRSIQALGPDDDAPRRAKVMAAVSLGVALTMPGKTHQPHVGRRNEYGRETGDQRFRERQEGRAEQAQIHPEHRRTATTE